MLTAQARDWHAGLSFAQEADDTFFGKSVVRVQTSLSLRIEFQTAALLNLGDVGGKAVCSSSVSPVYVADRSVKVLSQPPFGVL